MVASKTPNKTSTPTKAKLAPANTPAESRAQAAAKASPAVSETVEAPKPEAVIETVEAPKPEAVTEAALVAKPEPTPEPVAAVSVKPTPEPEAVVPVAVQEPDVAPEPEEAEIAVDEGVEQLASLAEQVIHEAEAIAGEAAHNFQVALKAATGAQGVVPTLNGINSYLHRSVRINSQFIEQFAGVRSPVELVQLQMNFLEEHRLAMLDFAKQWMAKK
jgi:outer membrane biosynthesis protein TonB